MKEKYLLCRPQGGVNDSLIQIEICWRYAERFGRTLIVDTESRGGFGVNFGRLFRSNIGGKSIVLSPSKDLLRELETLSTYPGEVNGRVNTYKPVYSAAVRNFVDESSGVPITFDFSIDHDWDLLVHEQCWGLEPFCSANCLQRLKMTAEFRHDVKSQLTDWVNVAYRSVIVRNSSDYQTDYVRFFQQIKDDVAGQRLLVVSDDSAVCDYAARFFRECEVLTYRKSYSSNDAEPYAQRMLKLDMSGRYKQVVSAFVDLLGASLASTLYACKLISGGAGGYSGFVLLAMELAKNKTIVINLLAEDIET